MAESCPALRVAVGCLLLCAPAAAQASDTAFAASMLQISNDLSSQRALEVADLDGDGLLDVIATRFSLQVWRNVGAGRLTPVLADSAFLKQGHVVVADLDGDGALSLLSAAVSGFAAVELSAPFLGGLQETLTTELDGGGFTWAAAGDLDGDGFADVVADAEFGASLRTWLGDGAGGLLPSVLAAAVPTERFELGDIDLDGRLDLLNASSAGAAALLGAGDGTLLPQPAFLAGPVQDVALGQLDGDGLPDAATAVALVTDGVTLFAGDGAGGFTATSTLPGPARVVDLADGDGDGDDDVIAADQRVTLHLQEGGLGTTSSGFHSGYNLVRDARGADLEGDGRAGALFSAGTPSLLLETGYVPSDSQGALGLELPLDGTVGSRLVAQADVDGDGQDEIVVYLAAAQQVVVHEVPGNGALGPAGPATPVVLAPDPPFSLVARVVDLDADAFEDLVMVGSVNELQPWRSNGDGTFTVGPALAPSVSNTPLVWGDVDGDGDDDLLLLGTSSQAWHPSLGDGTFGPSQAAFLEGGVTLGAGVLGDADGDGIADYFKGGTTLRWWKGDGAGGFLSPQTLAAGPESTVAELVEDLDGDGHLDVLAHGHGPALQNWLSGWITVVHGHGDGTFSASGVYPAGIIPTGTPPTTVDLDRDGRREIVVDTGASAHFGWMPQAADGSFGRERPLPVDFGGLFGALEYATADVDGNGLDDILTHRVVDVTLPELDLIASLVQPVAQALDLGRGKVGVQGLPVLVGTGRLVPGLQAQVSLQAAPSSVPVLLFLGLGTGYQPLAGGTLVPLPESVVGGLLTDAQGSLELAARWPIDAPPGLVVWAQAWALDPVTGAAVASNALQFEGQ